jgi:hypothetical protein
MGPRPARQGAWRGARQRRCSAANHDAARDRAEALQEAFAELAGLQAHKAADALNSRAIATPTGRPWSAKTVLRVRGVSADKGT